MSNHTKWRYANALMDLMSERSFRKITVNDICTRCDGQRQNFYYHFEDKYDLVTWIFLQDITPIIDENSGCSWEIIFEKIFEKMYTRKWFYKKAFEESGQNSLIEYVFKHERLIIENKFKQTRILESVDETMNFLIKYHSYACAYITRDWITIDNTISPHTLAKLMYDTMPAPLKKVLDE